MGTGAGYQHDCVDEDFVEYRETRLCVRPWYHFSWHLALLSVLQCNQRRPYYRRKSVYRACSSLEMTMRFSTMIDTFRKNSTSLIDSIVRPLNEANVPFSSTSGVSISYFTPSLLMLIFARIMTATSTSLALVRWLEKLRYPP